MCSKKKKKGKKRGNTVNLSLICEADYDKQKN
jgi:hypothetical protein